MARQGLEEWTLDLRDKEENTSIYQEFLAIQKLANSTQEPRWVTSIPVVIIEDSY